MDLTLSIRIQSVLIQLDNFTENFFQKIDRFEKSLLKKKYLHSNIELQPFKIKSAKIGIFLNRFNDIASEIIPVNDYSSTDQIDENDEKANENEKFSISFFKNLL